MFLEVNSDKAYISIRKLCSLKQLGLSSTPGILGERLITDFIDVLPNIEILHLHGKIIPYLNLDKIINLKQLLLNGDINEDFNFELFKNFYNKLEFLIINITNIDYESLLKLLGTHQFSNLDYLHISKFNIKRIEKKFIDRFPKLKVLRMIECNLEIIEDYAFSNLKQLVGLDLTKNNFEKLGRNTLSQLINLKNFSMCDNRLQSIDSTYMFLHLRNLKKLDLRNNKLSKTEIKALIYFGYSLEFLKGNNYQLP